MVVGNGSHERLFDSDLMGPTWGRPYEGAVYAGTMVARFWKHETSNNHVGYEAFPFCLSTSGNLCQCYGVSGATNVDAESAQIPGNAGSKRNGDRWDIPRPCTPHSGALRNLHEACITQKHKGIVWSLWSNESNVRVGTLNKRWAIFFVYIVEVQPTLKKEGQAG